MAEILLVDDEHSFLLPTRDLLIEYGHQVVTAENLMEARQCLASRRFDVLLVDLMLPDGNGLELLQVKKSQRPEHVIIITGQPGIRSVVRDLHGPGLDYLVKPIEFSELFALLNRSDGVPGEGPWTALPGLLLGDSPPMQRVYEQIKQVADTDTTVLICGESGTGKELVAEAIHLQSRRQGEFVPVNCGALSSELLASQLFGHEKGSFTGATRRHAGFFERAEQGTLFLDEITEMPIEQQPHLLRALETSHFTRLGAESETPFTSRVVAASNRNLAEAIRNNSLREDLYFRLSVFPIELPPLRVRPEDLPILANTFLDTLNQKYGTAKTLSPDSLDELVAWHWPGNVRELKHTVHRHYISTEGAEGVLQIPPGFSMDISSGGPKIVEAGRSIEEVERELIHATLEHCNGSKANAAAILGISLKTLYNRLNGYEKEMNRSA